MVITDMPPLPKLGLSPQEVAQEMGLSLRHVYRLLKAQQIPHRRFGKRIVVGRAALEDFLRGDSANKNGAGE